MAIPIKETPILEGENAKAFLDAIERDINNPVSQERIKEIKELTRAVLASKERKE